LNIYFIHVAIAGLFFGLAVGKPFLVIVTVFIIFVLSIFLDLRPGRDAEIKTDKK
jgi:uncharacterized membrane protein